MFSNPALPRSKRSCEPLSLTSLSLYALSLSLYLLDLGVLVGRFWGDLPTERFDASEPLFKRSWPPGSRRGVSPGGSTSSTSCQLAAASLLQS